MNRIYVFLVPIILLAITDTLGSKLNPIEHLRQYLIKRTASDESDDEDTPLGIKNDLHEAGQARQLLVVKGKVNEKFALAATGADPKNSVICSPLSALLPLGILLFGTGNDRTEKELLNAVGIKNKGQAHKHFIELLNGMKYLVQATVEIANQIYVNKVKNVKKSFKSDVKKAFGPSIKSIDLSNTVKTANEINLWVKNHTQGKIDKIVNANDLSPSASIIVVNALYFKALWEHKFEGSYKAPFYGAKGKKEASMMYITTNYHYGYSKALDAQAIKIPYIGEAAYMLIVLPRANDGLELLIRQLKLAPDLLNNIKMKKTYVQLLVPKFRIETTWDLKKLYEQVGLHEIFTRGMTELIKEQEVLVDRAIHKVMIEVDEWGTVAAASSVVGGMGSAYVPDMVAFKADHPFLFYIIADKQQLFAGSFVG